VTDPVVLFIFIAVYAGMILGEIPGLALQAARAGVRIDWRTHARSGIAITVATLAIAAA
jgi:hypothetical protein